MGSWKRRLMELLGATTDAELQQAMIEIKIEDNFGSAPVDSLVYRLATNIAPLAQTERENMMGLVTEAVILAAAYRFAGLEPDIRRIR